MSFRAAVRAAPAPVGEAYRDGKRALAGAHRSRVTCADARRLTGSIDLDSALANEGEYASEPRWDYGIGYRPDGAGERALWIEVHPADTSQVRQVVKKLHWLRTWLGDDGRELASLTVADRGVPPFVWIATRGVHIPRNSRQARLLRQEGLGMPRKALDLP